MEEQVLKLPRQALLEFNAVPPAARVVIEPLVLRFHPLIPSWAQLIYVNWHRDGDGNGTTIHCHANYAYRSFAMTFHPSFLAQTTAEHQQQMIHELLHASASVLADWARDTVNLLAPENEAPKFNRSLQEELRQRHEAFVQDLSLSLSQVL